MRFAISVLFTVVLVFGHIEDAAKEAKPPRSSTPFPDVVVDFEDAQSSEELAELVPPPASTFIGRSRRAIRDPISDYLDDKAANEVLGEKPLMVGRPPAPPPASAFQDFETSKTTQISNDNNQHQVVQNTAAQFDRPPVQSPAVAQVSGSSRVLPPNSRVTPYDIHIDPEYPAEAPRARGLVNVPEGWNSNRPVDWEFKAGYRWITSPAAAPSGRSWEIGMRGRNDQQDFAQVSQIGAYGNGQPQQFAQPSYGMQTQQTFYQPQSQYSGNSHGFSTFNAQSMYGPTAQLSQSFGGQYMPGFGR